jgi:hypothetical protein
MLRFNAGTQYFVFFFVMGQRTRFGLEELRLLPAFRLQILDGLRRYGALSW